MIVDNKHRFLQFELWKDCKNGCKFCQNRGLGDVDKFESLSFILDKLQSDEINKYNEIGFIGGEFFDGQLSDESIKLQFYKCVDYVIQLIKTNRINKFYVTATLIQKNNTDLCEFLNKIVDAQIQDKFLLCTSYDTIYRFSTTRTEKTWIDTMLMLKNNYPTLTVHTEIIVTEDFIQQVLTKKLNLTWFKTELNTAVDFIEPHTGFYYKDKYEFNKHLPNFLPKRKSFLNFLMFMYQNFPNDIPMLFNKNLKSNDFYIHYKNGQLIKFENRRQHKNRTCTADIDHIPHWGYIDSDIDIADDVEEFRRSVYGE